MNEFFATTADVFRLSGELDPAHDHYPPADGGARDAAGSRLRLARMIGHDARDASADEWHAFALRWRAQMLAEIRRNLVRVLQQAALPASAPLVAAGCGAFLVRELADSLGHPCIGFDALAAVAPDCADWARVCAPSVAVAQLAAAQFADPERAAARPADGPATGTRLAAAHPAATTHAGKAADVVSVRATSVTPPPCAS